MVLQLKHYHVIRIYGLILIMIDCFYVEIVPQTIQEEMQTIYVSLSELLRHFWSSFPPSSPQIEEKVRFFSRKTYI
jgi:hypothetical protein